jgi:hypothetical protein
MGTLNSMIPANQNNEIVWNVSSLDRRPKIDRELVDELESALIGPCNATGIFGQVFR